jgi:hypothetical protein
LGVALIPKRITLEDIETCVRNSDRLFSDSSNVSEPTKAALMELSIEESAKAWMLYLQFVKQLAISEREKIKPIAEKGLSTLSEVQKQELQGFGKAMTEYLNDLNIEEAFRGGRAHEVKLDYLALLIDQLKTYWSTMFQIAKSDPVARSVIPSKMDVSDIEKVGKEIASDLWSFKRQDILILRRVKEEGFYVDADENGKIISPESREYHIARLFLLRLIMDNGLKGLLIQARAYYTETK